MERLNKDQIEYALEQLEDLHPLEKTPFREAFPWFGAITCYKKPDGSIVSPSPTNADNEKGPLLEGNNKNDVIMIGGKPIKKKAPKKRKNPLDGASVEDPIAKLGFGIVAYVDILWCLIWTFTLYTIFLVPTFMFFSQGGAYKNVAVKSDYLDSYMGNLGYSSVQCA
jgi:hypothetical protein